MRFQIDAQKLNNVFDRRQSEPAATIALRHPARPDAKAIKVKHREDFAFLPKPKPLPDGFIDIGGIPVKKGKVPLVPDLRRLDDLRLRRPWRRPDWINWCRLVKTINPCLGVPAKTATVKIPVLPLTRMCRTSGDCARIYSVNDSGDGCVVNVITESVEASFTVQPNPSPNPPYPAGLPGAAVVHPFAKGGINHKYKRLYVPASFYTEVRDVDFGGFYVAVVDIDPESASYLDTVAWIDCGWIPEEVSFTADGEIGVIANYMQGTATIFQASTGAILAAEVDGFAGAAAGAGGALSRSVRIANVPGRGNRAFLTLTNEAPSAGVAIIDLDAPGFPRTNFTHPSFGFIDGVGITPEQDRILLVQSSSLHVVRVDGAAPVLESTIALPTGGGQSYFGGIGVRPSGNLAFVATGSANSTSPTQGTALALVNYATNTSFEAFPGLASQTWHVDLVEFGNPLKPHIICCSLSGELAIIPC